VNKLVATPAHAIKNSMQTLNNNLLNTIICLFVGNKMKLFPLACSKCVVNDENSIGNIQLSGTFLAACSLIFFLYATLSLTNNS
jgi:hypothetical protein